MAASASDKARKSYSFLQKTLNGAIGSGDTTIALNNTTNVPTDTAVDFIIDRIDSNGNRTTGNVKELCKGVVSGSNLINVTRGLHGTTAQSHSSGAVVEFIASGVAWNDLIDLVLQDHSNPSGYHKNLTDANGNEWIKQTATTSAVNEITVGNAAVSGTPYIQASGDDTNVNLLLLGKGSGVVIPYTGLAEGYMINGKISASVASNNLTLALKTLAGTDPSAANPVYVNIGGTLRSVTSALSVTKNAGTNWMNLGSAEHATQDVDLFAYLGYNATDGVVIGFSRIPHAIKYGDFSTTSTNDRYCAISTITNAASTDSYVVIGRFNATLSAAASYNWSIPGTAVVIQRPIYETRWLVWVPSPTGFSVAASGTTYKYRIRPHICELIYYENSPGTSNATTMTATAPITSANVSNMNWGTLSFVQVNNGAPTTTPGRALLPGNSTTITFGLNPGASGGYTAANGKAFDMNMVYEV